MFYLLSSILLLITLVIYFVYPALLNYGTRLQRHFAANMFIAFVVISINQIQAFNVHYPGLCILFGYILHFEFIATYMFMTLICFSTYRHIKTGLKMNDGLYMKSVVFGYAFPASISAVMGILQLSAPCNQISPKFGERTCFFHGKKL